MRNWDESEERGDSSCSADADWIDAQRVARHLGIPIHEANFVRQYWTQVFSDFVAQVRQPSCAHLVVSLRSFVREANLVQALMFRKALEAMTPNLLSATQANALLDLDSGKTQCSTGLEGTCKQRLDLSIGGAQKEEWTFVVCMVCSAARA